MRPFAARRISFADCTNETAALARLEQVVDDLEAETIRQYAVNLLEREPDIAVEEFQNCVWQFRAALAQYREETRNERVATFRQMLADTRQSHRDRP